MKLKSNGKLVYKWTTSDSSHPIAGRATISNSSRRTMILTKNNVTSFDPCLEYATEYYFEMDPGIVVDVDGNEFAGIVGASTQKASCPVKADICILVDTSGSVEY